MLSVVANVFPTTCLMLFSFRVFVVDLQARRPFSLLVLMVVWRRMEERWLPLLGRGVLAGWRCGVVNAT